MKPRLDTSQGAPPSHQMDGNVGNGIPSRYISPRSLKGGYRKNIGRRSYISQYGDFPSLLFCPFDSDKDAT